MTAKKDLKRRVRERQVETGESYVAARRHVLAQTGVSADAIPESEPEAEATAPEPPVAPVALPKPAAFAVDEMFELTEAAAAAGFRCRVMITRSLTDRVDAADVIERLRLIIDGTADDPAMLPLRTVLLHGTRIGVGAMPRALWFETARQFLKRARAGIGGISERGDMLAFMVEGQMVLAHVGHWPRPSRPDAPARLSLSAIGDVSEGLDSMSVLFVR